MLGFNGGRIGKTNTVFTGTVSNDPNYSNVSLLLNGNETSGSDPNYSSVSLLLNGNGTNGSTTFTDSSSYGHTVTPAGNAQISTTQSKFGGASMYFDGSGDYLSVPSNASFDFGSGNFTVEFWIYFNSVTGFRNLFNKRSSTSVTNWIWFGTNNSSLVIYISSNGSSWDIANLFNFGNTALSTGQWYHIALVRNGTEIAAYVNGTKSANTITTSSSFNLGSYNFNIGGDTDNFYSYAYIDDFRITKGVARYTSNFTPPTAQFPGNTITDSSSYGHTVTPVGNARISTTQSKFGGASMYFDGNGDYLTALQDSSYSFGTGDFTIEAWLYITAYGGGFQDYGGGLVDTRGVNQSNWANGVLLVLTTNGSLRVFTSSIVSTSTSQISLNTWTHVSLVRSGGSATFYIGGQSAGAFSFGNNLSQQDMTIGTAIDLRAQNTTLKYNGYIDDLRITKGVARYTANFTPPTAQLPGAETGTSASGVWTPREQCDAVRKGIWP